MKKKCECHAYSANECVCRVWERVHIEDIKQNGIDPKSKLFWALHRFDYVAQEKNGLWFLCCVRPRFVTGVPMMNGKQQCSWSAAKHLLEIKIKYTGDWRDSLHYRGDYE